MGRRFVANGTVGSAVPLRGRVGGVASPASRTAGRTARDSRQHERERIDAEPVLSPCRHSLVPLLSVPKSLFDGRGQIRGRPWRATIAYTVLIGPHVPTP